MIRELYFELFCGVGFCNQLFSLETAIYMSNILDAKLILLIKHPLVHCGRASWEYGTIFNYLTQDYKQYLPRGIDVYYKKIPSEITEITEQIKKDKLGFIDPPSKMSQMVFVDNSLNIPENKNDIDKFSHYRRVFNFNIEELKIQDRLFYTKSNASRMFYNYYTTKANYKLMQDIALTIKIKRSLHEVADSIISGSYSTTNRKRFSISLHLRFGDYFKKSDFVERWNTSILRNVIPFIRGHTTNLIKPYLLVLTDRKDNNTFFNELEKETNNKVYFLDDIDKVIRINLLQCHEYGKINVSNQDVSIALIQMLIASKTDEFIGCLTSTFSNYIQYMRYRTSKSYYFYSNITDNECKQCKFVVKKPKEKYHWQQLSYRGGHPVSWHAFWDIPHTNNVRNQICINGKQDGFGSVFQAYLSLAAYCDFKNKDLEFIHNPFYHLQHNDEMERDFHKIMNDFVNFEHNYDIVHNKKHIYCDVMKEGPMVHGSLHPEFFYTNEFRNKIITQYNASKQRFPEITDFPAETFNISLHIRRGDVSKTQHSSRFTSNKEYIKILECIFEELDMSILEEQKPELTIRVYSEGKEEDFKEFDKFSQSYNVKYHLNENVRQTFHDLVNSDILIISKSSFSYCAGLLNRNVVISNNIQKWWHKPLEDWLIIG